MFGNGIFQENASDCPSIQLFCFTHWFICYPHESRWGMICEIIELHTWHDIWSFISFDYCSFSHFPITTNEHLRQFWLHHFGASSPRHNLCDSDWSSVAIDNPQGPTYLAVTPLNSNVLQIVEEFLPLIHYRVPWVACHRSNPWPIWAQDALVLGPRGGKGEREPGWAFPCNTLCFCVYAMHATFSLLLLYHHNR